MRSTLAQKKEEYTACFSINKVRHAIAKVLLLGFFSRLESILAFKELN